MIAYRGPTLITEPELRWPIVLLAAAITALLAILTASLYYVAMTQSAVKSDLEPRLEWALQPGQPEFEEFRQHIAIEQLVGIEKVHPFDTLAVAMTATVRNNTGRTIMQRVRMDCKHPGKLRNGALHTKYLLFDFSAQPQRSLRLCG